MPESPGVYEVQFDKDTTIWRLVMQEKARAEAAEARVRELEAELSRRPEDQGKGGR